VPFFWTTLYKYGFAGVENVGVERRKVISMLSREISLLIHGMTKQKLSVSGHIGEQRTVLRVFVPYFDD